MHHGETDDPKKAPGEEESREPPTAEPVARNGSDGRADGAPERGELRRAKPGRPPEGWRFRLVRIEAGKYPEFMRDPQHPFAAMAAEERMAQLDAFCARLRARARRKPLGLPPRAAAA